MKLLASIKKEFLLLSRDVSGLAILFIMPVFMVLVMTLIQDVTFRRLDQTGIRVLILDQDQDSLGIGIRRGLAASGFFKAGESDPGVSPNESVLREAVRKGDYQIGIIIREGSTDAIRSRARALAGSMILGMNIPDTNSREGRITIYFDPAIKTAEKQSLRATLLNFASQVEARLVIGTISHELPSIKPGGKPISFDPTGIITMEEIYATGDKEGIIPNAVQHNVPAWTVFAMFFIVIPLTGNLIRERESGTAQRLRLMPVSYAQVVLAKIIVFLVVCFIQFLLMLGVGIYVLPGFGMPALEPGNHPLALAVIALASALAATGYGVMIGTISTTHDQAAVFGTVSVIILAAIGGAWVPVFMMPETMRQLSHFSPLNWGLEGFQAIFIRNANITGVLKYSGLLTLFALVTLGAALAYEKLRNH